MLDASRIRQVRLEAQLSQQHLGELIGQDQQYISKLERGVLTGMTIDTLEKLADALKCTTDYLLGRIPCCMHSEA